MRSYNIALWFIVSGCSQPAEHRAPPINHGETVPADSVTGPVCASVQSATAALAQARGSMEGDPRRAIADADVGISTLGEGYHDRAALELGRSQANRGELGPAAATLVGALEAGLAGHRRSLVSLHGRSDLVAIGRVVTLGPAPGFWSGHIPAYQEAHYEIERVIRGAEQLAQSTGSRTRSLTVHHAVVSNSITAERDQPRLSRAIFHPGAQLLFSAVRAEDGRWVSMNEDLGACSVEDPARRALRLCADAEVHLRGAQTLREQGQLLEAVAKLDEGIDLLGDSYLRNPHNPGLVDDSGMLLANGRATRDQGDLEGAFVDINQVLRGNISLCRQQWRNP